MTTVQPYAVSQRPALILAVPPAGRSHRDRISLRSALIRAKKIAANYNARLRKIARHIDDIVKGFDASTEAGQRAIQSHLSRYADILTPWAEASADRMVAEIADADKQRWRRMSEEIGRGIEREIQATNVAPAMAQMKVDQVRLIRSLPTDASARVNRLVTEGITKGTRASAIAEQIYETGLVTRSRADTIARTETGRVATTLQMARAQAVGSTHFRWRTAGDTDVRPSHRRLNGQIFAWNDPPVCDDPDLKALPGCIFNCRCFAEPIID